MIIFLIILIIIKFIQKGICYKHTFTKLHPSRETQGVMEKKKRKRSNISLALHTFNII